LFVKIMLSDDEYGTKNKTKTLAHCLPDKEDSGALVRQRIIPTELPPLVGEVSANGSGQRVSRIQHNE
jgi:hypothetical protein